MNRAKKTLHSKNRHVFFFFCLLSDETRCWQISSLFFLSLVLVVWFTQHRGRWKFSLDFWAIRCLKTNIRHRNLFLFRWYFFLSVLFYFFYGDSSDVYFFYHRSVRVFFSSSSAYILFNQSVDSVSKKKIVRYRCHFGKEKKKTWLFDRCRSSTFGKLSNSNYQWIESTLKIRIEEPMRIALFSCFFYHVDDSLFAFFSSVLFFFFLSNRFRRV